MSQVAEQVQGGLIRPLQVIYEQQQRCPLAQRVKEPRHRFKEPSFGGQLILGGSWQVGVAHPQFRQQARELRQPHVLQQILRRVLRLQALSQGLHQWLVG